MAEDNQLGYGYGSDEVRQSNFHFGGNFNVTRLVKFEYITNAGKGGTAAEALEIVFDINGTEKSYRKFPITKAYTKGDKSKGIESKEVTAPNSPEMQEARLELSQILTHIVKCFRSDADVSAALSRKIVDFKDYCSALRGLLPSNFSEVKLDIFLQWQWKISGTAKETYLEIPDKMKYGKFVCAAIPPVGKWTELQEDNTLSYIDEAKNKHIFTRGKWFLESAYAHKQKEDTNEAGEAAMGQATQAQGWAQTGQAPVQNTDTNTANSSEQNNSPATNNSGSGW